MVQLFNPGTYSTRKCSSWCADIHKDPEYRHPKIQKSKNPKIQNKLQDSVDVKRFGFLDLGIFRFLDLWIFGFLDFGILWIFWVFGFLDFLCFTLVFSNCRNSSKIGFRKNGVCITIYSVFQGCACRRGGTIYVYTYVFAYTCIFIYIYVYMYICVCA